MSQPPKPPKKERNELTQSTASVATWSYWESLGYSEEQPLKAEYFVKRMWPKAIPVQRSVSASANLQRALLAAPLELRKVQDGLTTDFRWEPEEGDTEEYSSEYEEDEEVELPEDKIF